MEQDCAVFQGYQGSVIQITANRVSQQRASGALRAFCLSQIAAAHKARTTTPDATIEPSIFCELAGAEGFFEITFACAVERDRCWARLDQAIARWRDQATWN